MRPDPIFFTYIRTTTRGILNLICFSCLVSSLVLFGIVWHRVSIYGDERSISSDPANPHYMEPIAKEKFLASQHTLNDSAALLMCAAIITRLFQEILKKCDGTGSSEKKHGQV
jgi:hypothetical protein